jgi:hypothetical protein
MAKKAKAKKKTAKKAAKKTAKKTAIFDPFEPGHSVFKKKGGG